MRTYLVIKETMAPTREIDILFGSNDGQEALEKLAAISDEWEEAITDGSCRVVMTTYKEKNDETGNP